MRAISTIVLCLMVLTIGVALGAAIATVIERAHKNGPTISQEPPQMSAGEISKAAVGKHLCSTVQRACSENVHRLHLISYGGMTPALDTHLEGDRERLEKLELGPDDDHPNERPNFKAASRISIWSRPPQPDGRMRF